MSPIPRREAGYALLAAVLAVAAFAYVAFQVLAADQGTTASVAARVRQAKLVAAADAGMALAIHGLAVDDPTERWSIDRSARRLDFEGVDLTVVIEDERGKAPLAGLNDDQSRALFQGAGASGDRLDALVDEFRDWQVESDVVAPASSVQLQSTASAAGLQPRHGAFRTVGEMMGMKDMDPALLRRIAPAVTVFFEQSGPFEPKNADALAIRAMSAEGTQDAENLQNMQGFALQKPEVDILPDDHLVGRTLTVQVIARDRYGDRTHRTAIVELTGAKADPYWIRYAE